MLRAFVFACELLEGGYFPEGISVLAEAAPIDEEMAAGIGLADDVALEDQGEYVAGGVVATHKLRCLGCSEPFGRYSPGEQSAGCHMAILCGFGWGAGTRTPTY